MEHKDDSDTDHGCSPWNNSKEPRKESGATRNPRKN